MSSYPVKSNPHITTNKINNLGGTFPISAKSNLFPGWMEVARVYSDEVRSWTVTVETRQATSGVRVLAQIEYGAGNSVSRKIYDVTDHVDIPVVGESVRVAVGMELLADTPADPVPSAIVTAGISAGVPGFPFRVADWTSSPPLAAVGSFGDTLPARLVAFNAIHNGTVGAAAEYIMFFDQVPALAPGAIPVFVRQIPSGLQTDYRFEDPYPFANGIVWALSSTLAAYTPSMNEVRIDAELATSPSGTVTP